MLSIKPDKKGLSLIKKMHITKAQAIKHNEARWKQELIFLLNLWRQRRRRFE